MKRSVTASGTARTDSQADVRYERKADINSKIPFILNSLFNRSECLAQLVHCD